MKIRVRPCKIKYVEDTAKTYNKNTFFVEMLKDGVEFIKIIGGYETINEYINNAGNKFKKILSDNELKYHPYYYISKE